MTGVQTCALPISPYYRQIGHNPSFISVRLNLGSSGKRFRVTNLISSTPIEMALTELFAPASAAAGGDFDRLMVPFLCVSSDMNAREPVVMRNGDRIGFFHYRSVLLLIVPSGGSQ